MKSHTLVTLLILLIVLYYVDGKKSISFGSRGSSSARGSSSRRTNYKPQPSPTSLSYPQPQQSAPKPSLSGWQEKPKNNRGGGQSHSYPSSQTGLSGNQPVKSPTTNQESIQRSSASQNLNGKSAQPNSQSGHSYPASTGLSGNSGSGYPPQSGTGISHQQGSNYPQSGGGLSGSGGAPPPYSGAAAPPPYSGAAAPPAYPGASRPTSYPSNNYGNNYQHPPPPPPYSNYGGHGGYGGQPSYHPSGPQMPGYGSQSPGYFGNYANKGMGMSRTGTGLMGVGIAGAGVGTLLTGLALWNLARSTGNRHHTVIYDNRGQPVAVAANNATESQADSMLADLVNCSLSISNDEKTEVLAIPCAIATSFSPDAEIKTSGNNNNVTDNTKCTVSVINKSGKEYMTTIPCSILLNTAAENNVTEPIPPVEDAVNGTMVIPTPAPVLDPNSPSALSLTSSEMDQSNATHVNCTLQPGEMPDPINPCIPVTHNLTVIPLTPAEINADDQKV